MQSTNKEKSEMEESIRNLNYEKKALEREIADSGRELEEVKNLQKKKMETLARALPNGADAVKAMKWLHANRDQFSGKNTKAEREYHLEERATQLHL